MHFSAFSDDLSNATRLDLRWASPSIAPRPALDIKETYHGEENCCGCGCEGKTRADARGFQCAAGRQHDHGRSPHRSGDADHQKHHRARRTVDPDVTPGPAQGWAGGEILAQTCRGSIE